MTVLNYDTFVLCVFSQFTFTYTIWGIPCTSVLVITLWGSAVFQLLDEKQAFTVYPSDIMDPHFTQG